VIASPKATVDLNALQGCTIDRGTFLKLTFEDSMALELQAATAEEAESWHGVLVGFSPTTGARKASMIQSLEHYAPRKGTLVFERKGSFETKAGRALPFTVAAAACSAPEQKAQRLPLPDRIAKLEGEAFGKQQAGTTKGRVEALEQDVLDEAQAGPIAGRVAALEAEYGISQ
jgi:hypothetical protein